MSKGNKTTNGKALQTPMVDVSEINYILERAVEPQRGIIMIWLVKYDGEVIGRVMTNHSMTEEEICEYAGVRLAMTEEEYNSAPENEIYFLEDLSIEEQIVEAEGIKKICYCTTNGYDMIVSVDNDNNCRYLTETNDFPHIDDMNKEEQEEAARKFLEAVEDDSSWEDDCTYDQIFTDGVDIIAEIEKEL